jgi:hypothetical protein
MVTSQKAQKVSSINTAFNVAPVATDSKFVAIGFTTPLEAAVLTVSKKMKKNFSQCVNGIAIRNTRNVPNTILSTVSLEMSVATTTKANFRELRTAEAHSFQFPLLVEGFRIIENEFIDVGGIPGAVLVISVASVQGAYELSEIVDRLAKVKKNACFLLRNGNYVTVDFGD